MIYFRGSVADPRRVDRWYPNPSVHSDADPDPTSHFDADVPVPHQSDAICNHWSPDPPRLHIEPPQLLKFDFEADLDPAFDFDAYPDPAFYSDADPGYFSLFCLRLLDLFLVNIVFYSLFRA